MYVALVPSPTKNESMDHENYHEHAPLSKRNARMVVYSAMTMGLAEHVQVSLPLGVQFSKSQHHQLQSKIRL